MGPVWILNRLRPVWTNWVVIFNPISYRIVAFSFHVHCFDGTLKCLFFQNKILMILQLKTKPKKALKLTLLFLKTDPVLLDCWHFIVSKNEGV